MKNKNVNSTRYYSSTQEESVAKALNGHSTSNSGAAKFSGGDVIQEQASILIECKTTMTDKESFSIKKEWIDKNKEEAFAQRMSNHCIAFNFGPNQPNYYVIDENLMRVLISKLQENNL